MNKALQYYKNAEHLLNVTFPLIKDPKLFLGIVENLDKALQELEANPKLLQHLQSILEKHKLSPIEFRKKEMFVICDDNYDLEIVTVEELKLYLKEIKHLLAQLNRN